MPVTETFPVNVAPVNAAKVDEAYGYVTNVLDEYVNDGNVVEA